MARKLRMVMWLLALLVLIVPAATQADYIHGYFRYTIADESITITAYTGREESVTVPSMIGLYPVNTIAAGAFANNSYVKTVTLPDTVTTVEAGAFAPGQTVIYLGPKPVPAPTPRGVYLDNGDLVAVDDEGSLLRVAPDGSAVVLDSQHRYVVTEESGEKVIRREDGAAVILGENGSVILPDIRPATTPTGTSAAGADSADTPADTKASETTPAPPLSGEEAEAATDDTPEPTAAAAEAPKAVEAPKATEAPKTTVAPKATKAPEAIPTSQAARNWIVGGLGALTAAAVILLLKRKKKA